MQDLSEISPTFFVASVFVAVLSLDMICVLPDPFVPARASARIGSYTAGLLAHMETFV
jgi:hypothetical protein